MNKLYGTTFCGNEASDYAKENNRLDYATLAKAFDAVLNNDIMQKTWDIGYWEQENGFIDNSDEIDELNEAIEKLNEEIDVLNEAIEELEDKQSELDDDKEDEYVELSAEIIRKEDEVAEIEKKISELEDEICDLEHESEPEIFQYYIISDEGARILKDWTNEIVFYNEELDMYIWGVTHWGTSWSYVLTNIKLNCGEEAYR